MQLVLAKCRLQNLSPFSIDMKSLPTELLKIENLTVRASTTRFRGNNVGCNKGNKNDIVWIFDKMPRFTLPLIKCHALCQWYVGSPYVNGTMRGSLSKGKLNPGTIKLSHRRLFQRQFKLQARVSSLFRRDVYQTSVSAFSDAKIGPDVWYLPCHVAILLGNIPWNINGKGNINLLGSTSHPRICRK